MRDLAERGVLQGQPGGYVSTADAAEVSMPATVQATIAARIDRLDPAAKRTLSAAAVIGAKVSRDLLETLGIEPVLEDLVRGQFLDQITFTADPEYVFHHPLIRTVAYESQLKSDRAELHRRLAAAIEATRPRLGGRERRADRRAPGGRRGSARRLRLAHAGRRLVDLPGHQRGQDQLGQQARQIADQLPADDPNRLAMQIAPRTLLCGNAYRIGGTVADTGFDELRELCTAAGDKLSLAIGMTGLVTAMTFNDRITEAAQLATECAALIESIGDPALIVALLPGPMMAKCQAGEMVETLRLAQRVIDLADGDATMGNLVIGITAGTRADVSRRRPKCRWVMPGFREHIEEAVATARPVDPSAYTHDPSCSSTSASRSGCRCPTTPRCGRPPTHWRSPSSPATP